MQSPPAADANQDAAGVVDSSAWTTVATVWAAIDPAAGAEQSIGDQLVGIQRFRVEMRRPIAPSPTIDTTMRLYVTHGPYYGAYLYVDAAAGLGERRQSRIELICRQGRPG